MKPVIILALGLFLGARTPLPVIAALPGAAPGRLVAEAGLRTGPRNSGRLHKIMKCASGRLCVRSSEILDICTALPDSAPVLHLT